MGYWASYTPRPLTGLLNSDEGRHKVLVGRFPPWSSWVAIAAILLEGSVADKFPRDVGLAADRYLCVFST